MPKKTLRSTALVPRITPKRAASHSRLILRPLAAAISVMLFGAAMPVAHGADYGITDLGSLPGYSYSWAEGVNAAGDVVVGYAWKSGSNTEMAFRWTASEGMQSLGTVSGDVSSIGRAVNDAGDVVVGNSLSSAGKYRAFRWTAATGMLSLGTLAGGTTSSANDVNAAGDVVVGYSDSSQGGMRAYRWTAATGMQNLTELSGTYASEAYGVNAVGDVVVGYFDSAVGMRAFRWTAATGVVSLGTLSSSGGSSVAYAVNAAGDVVVGWSGLDNGDNRAFRWTQSTGMVNLGVLNSGDESSVAYGVNAAGNVVVGYSGSEGSVRAFRWTQATGMQSIEDWLAASGVTVDPTAVKAQGAYGVNADGNVVVGRLANSHAFIAVAEKGMLDTDNVNRGLAASGGTIAMAAQGASMIMNGAHGNPLRGLPGAGKQNMWLAGDWGHAESAKADGNQGAGEVGYARGLSDTVTVKLALGRSYSKQDTLYGGTARMDGIYVMPELTAKIASTPLYATVATYYSNGDSDVTRGYDNAGVREYSRGSADTETLGARVRIDWLNALTFAKTELTPYTGLSYARTKIDAYTETGGAFPAHWNSRSEHSTEARLGVDGVHQLDARLNLLSKLEGVHRFNNRGAGVSGDVAGLYGFSFDGETYKRNWLRVGAGVEGKLGEGTGSLMLNASTENDAVRYWLAASYRQAF